ncbi:hypothetical protein BK809_0000181, partial [Diplodia seriata]
FQLVASFGVGLVFQAPLVALQTRVAPADVATAISIAIGGVVFQKAMQAHRPQLLVVLDGDADAADKLAGDAAGANVGLVARLEPESARAAVRKAFAESLRNVWILYTCTAMAGLAVSFLNLYWEEDVGAGRLGEEGE